MITKEAIVQLLKTDDRAVVRALLVLNERQTQDEQSSENTKYLNGRGVRPCHARMLSSMAKQFIHRNFLSQKQINYWRVLDKAGNMRIGIYAGQLLEEAEAKAARKISTPVIVDRDYGNDMEYLMVLEEQLGSVLDSDDPLLIMPISKEIDMIKAYWKNKGNI